MFLKFFVYIMLVLLSQQVAANEGKKIKALFVFANTASNLTTSSRTMAGMDLALKANPDQARHIQISNFEIGPNIKGIIEDLEAYVLKNKPDILIGGIKSNEAFAISEIAEKYQIPYISPFATNRALTLNKQYTYRVCFDDGLQSTAVGNFISEQVAKDAVGVVLYGSNNSYAMGIKNDAVTYFQDKSIGLIPILVRSEKDLDTKTLDKIKQIAPDFLILPMYQLQAASMLTKLVPVLDKNTLYIGTDSWGGGKVFHDILKNQIPSFRGYYVQHWSRKNLSKANLDFKKLIQSNLLEEKYKSKDTAMISPLALGYDTMSVVLNAIQRFKLQKLDAKKLNDFFASTRLSGATGWVDLSTSNQDKQLYIYSINVNKEDFLQVYNER